MNIVFAGTPEFGLPCLSALLHSSHPLLAVYTQPDRPSGRGRKLCASPVKIFAETHGIPVHQPTNFKSPESIAEMAALKPDILIVIAYGLLLPSSVLDLPRFGCLNVHASLLPHWRGASPIQQAILAGDSESGITLMQMDMGLDTGDMVARVACPISKSDTAGSLHDKLAALAVSPLLDTLESIAAGKSNPQKQDSTLASYARKISKEDATIVWRKSVAEIDRMIRAYNPWPIASTKVDETTLSIHQAEIWSMDTVFEAPGTVLDLTKKGMQVATGQGVLLVKKIQFPGGKILSIADYLNAHKTQLHPGCHFHGA